MKGQVQDDPDQTKPAGDADHNASSTDQEQAAAPEKTPAPPSPELPPEIRQRLRKLDKLEATYPGRLHHRGRIGDAWWADAD